MDNFIIYWKSKDNLNAGIIGYTHKKKIADFLMELLKEHGDPCKEFLMLTKENDFTNIFAKEDK